MQSFIALYGFLEIVLRAFLLATQAILVGAVAFLALVISPLGATLSGDEGPIVRRCLRILYWSCLASAFGELVAGGVLIAMLVGTLRVEVALAASANAVVAHFIAAIVAGALALIGRRGGEFPKWRGIAIGLALLLVCAHVGVTHAASRPDAAKLLVATEVLHILAASIWLGGIPYFVVALGLTDDGASRRLVASKFSRIAMCAVAALVAGGVLMVTRYTTSLSALCETNYGVLISNKIVLLIGLLCFATANLLTVRKLWRVSSTPIKTLSRFAEVEVGLGVVALFCAAALASSSPAIDAGAERTSLTEISARFAPRWPSFDSPAYAELSAARISADSSNVAEPAAPSVASGARIAADIAWAEMNHHLAGVWSS